MTNSEVNGIEEAPARENCSRQIFKNFRDATVALLECDDTPRNVCGVVAEMLDELGSECGGHAEVENEYAYRVISKVFDLDDEGEEEAPRLDSTPMTSDAPGPYKEIRAEEFTLVDGDGNAHATLQIAGGGAVLTMRDSQGRPRLRLRAGDNEAMITICGERGVWGRGVLAATDEAERIRIGYDTADQDPRVAIQDGNENECVSLWLCGKGEQDEGKSGVVHLKGPHDGAYAVVDHMGLGVYTGSHELLAECAALPEETPTSPAPAPEPPPIAADLETPKAAPELRSQVERGAEPEYQFGCFGARSALGEEAVRNLVSRIIPRDDDDAVKAFVALIDSIAYNNDRLIRDDIALQACGVAYQRTMAYRDVAEKFFDEATAELRSHAS